MTTRRFLSLWLPRLATDRARRLITSPPRPPLAASRGSTTPSASSCVDAAAARLGLTVGLTLADARARHPALVAVEARPGRGTPAPRTHVRLVLALHAARGARRTRRADARHFRRRPSLRRRDGARRGRPRAPARAGDHGPRRRRRQSARGLRARPLLGAKNRPGRPRATKPSQNSSTTCRSPPSASRKDRRRHGAGGLAAHRRRGDAAARADHGAVRAARRSRGSTHSRGCRARPSRRAFPRPIFRPSGVSPLPSDNRGDRGLLTQARRRPRRAAERQARARGGSNSRFTASTAPSGASRSAPRGR